MRLVIIATVIVAVVSLFNAASVLAEPALSVDRATGTANDSFTFSGAGFEAGTVLKGKYTAPNGREYGFTEGYGEKSFIAAADGTWSYSFKPASSPYGGATSGSWTMTFCLAQDPTKCWSSEFRVEGGDMAGGGGEGGASGY